MQINLKDVESESTIVGHINPDDLDDLRREYQFPLQLYDVMRFLDGSISAGLKDENGDEVLRFHAVLEGSAWHVKPLW